MSSNRVYDILKWIAIIFLPALAKLIEGIFGVWGIPYGAEVASTIIYFQVFLGAILCVSSINYYKGQKPEIEEIEEKEDAESV